MRAWLAHAGSLRVTLALLGLVGVVVLAGSATGEVPVGGLSVLGLLLAGQLLVGLAVHPSLRRQAPLLLAHLGLLALGVELGLSRLMSTEGRFELTEGVAWDGTLIDGRRGPWAGDALRRASFVQRGFEIDYAPGLQRGATRNEVQWTDEQGVARRAVIGDHRPLVMAGARFTTTPNKGFAPVLQWQPDQGAPVAGAVHLPSFPAQELAQWREWALPDGRGGRPVWVMLEIEGRLIDPDAASRFRRPERHALVLRMGTERWTLQPGDAVSLPGGRLQYLELRTWMGYRVSHDPLLPWLLATALASTGALALHYARKFRVSARGLQTAPAWSREHALDA